MEYDSYNRPRRAKKPMTEQQALLKLTTLCTQSEHCSQEMLDKMKKWELAEDAIARNMQFLIEKKFIDDERYARFFINDKVKYNKWGATQGGASPLAEAYLQGHLRPHLRRDGG